MFCKYCGKELADGVKFYSRCGKQLFHTSLDLQGETKEGPIFKSFFKKSDFCFKSAW